MAMSMEALLKIKADVQGEGAVQGLAAKLGGLQRAGAAASGGFKGLAGAAGGLISPLQSLVPLATGAGLVAMAKGAIDAADNMNDMSQKTGVSVERLSQFDQAARMSGTSIEGVGSALVKLNRGLVDGKAQEALQGIGISATDAAGKLKPTDQILLEVANKFAAMPDGAEKSALAMQLFGKAGADMIPMLNMGDEAIKQLAVTMTSDFAKGADNFNDKMEKLNTKFQQLGVEVGSALMPHLERLADGLLGIISAFERLPAPVQGLIVGIGALAAAFVVLAPAISAVISLAGALAGLQLGATIAGWLGAVGPMIAGITAAFGGLMAWITGTLLPFLAGVFSGPVGWTILAIAAVVAMCIAFREPIGQFLTWLGTEFMKALEALGKLAHAVFVQPWIDLWNNVLRGPVTALWDWLKGYVEFSMKTAYALAYQVFVQPWINLWNNVLRDPVTKMGEWIKGIWKGITDFFGNNVIKPIQSAWDGLTQALPKAMETVGNAVRGIWESIVNGAKSVINGFLQAIANNINTVVDLVNQLIGAFNSLPGPDIPMVPTFSIPYFAEGGVVSKPTLAMVGEGGESEYIIPESKMAAASSSYLAGARGADVMRAAGAAGTSSTPAINVQTGPVVEFNGERYVTLGDLERGLQQVASSVINGLRTPAGRYAIGVG